MVAMSQHCRLEAVCLWFAILSVVAVSSAMGQDDAVTGTTDAGLNVFLGDPVGFPRSVVRQFPWQVNVVCVSPEGDLIAVGGNSVELIPLDEAHCCLLAPREIVHAGSGRCTALFFSQPRVLLAGFADGMMAVIQWSSEGAISVAEVAAHRGAVTAVSAAGDVVLTSSQDGSLRFWRQSEDAQGLEPVTEVVVDLGGVRTVALSPAGERVGAGLSDGSVRVWTVRATPIPGLETEAAFQVRGPVRSIAFFRTSSDILIASDQISIWQSDDHRVLELDQVTSPVPWTWVTSATLSQDDRWVATGYSDGSASIWRLDRSDDSLRMLPAMTWHAHDLTLTSVCFSPGTTSLATASADQSLRLWPLDTGFPRQPDIPRFPRHEGVRELCVAPDRPWVISASTTGHARVWALCQEGLGNLEEMTTLDVSTRAREAIAIGPHGNVIHLLPFTGSATSPSLSVVDDTGSVCWVGTAPPRSSDATIVGAARGTQILASASQDQLDLWTPDESQSPPLTRVCTLQTEGPITCIALSDSGTLVAGGSGTRVSLWRLGSVTTDVGPPSTIEHPFPVSSLAVSSDTTRVLVSGGASVRLWELPSGALDAPIGPCDLQCESPVDDMAFTSDARWALTAGRGVIELWWLANRTPRRVRAFRFPADVRAIAVTPDDRWLISAHADGSIHATWLFGVRHVRIGDDAIEWELSRDQPEGTPRLSMEAGIVQADNEHFVVEIDVANAADVPAYQVTASFTVEPVSADAQGSRLVYFGTILPHATVARHIELPVVPAMLAHHTQASMGVRHQWGTSPQVWLLEIRR